MKQKDLLVLLVSASIIVFAWIGFSVYHSFITSTISETVSIQISPIKPAFDTRTVANMKTRQPVIPVFEAQSVPSSVSARPLRISTPLAEPISPNPLIQGGPVR